MSRLGRFTKVSCTRCPETDRTKFAINKRRPNAIYSMCYVCFAKYNREKYHANVEEARRKHRIRAARYRARQREQVEKEQHDEHMYAEWNNLP